MFLKKVVLSVVILTLVATSVRSSTPVQAQSADARILDVIRTSGPEDVIEVIIDPTTVVINSDGSVTADVSIKALKLIAYELSFEVRGVSNSSLDSLTGIEFLPLYSHNTYHIGSLTFPEGTSLVIKQDKGGTTSKNTGLMVIIDMSLFFMELIGMKPPAELNTDTIIESIFEINSVVPEDNLLAITIAAEKLFADIGARESITVIIEDFIDLISRFPVVTEAIAKLSTYLLKSVGVKVTAATVGAAIGAALLFWDGIPRVLDWFRDLFDAPQHVETEIRAREQGLPADVYMLVDLSGSFGDDLPLFKSQVPSIISSLLGSNPNTRFGLGKFEDYPISPFGDAAVGDKAYERLVDLTFDTNLVLDAISNLFVRFGADEPESQLAALYQTATGAGQDLSADGFPGASIPSGQQANFRDGATKLIMLWTDAAFHNPGDPGSIPYPGPSFDETVDAILALDPPKVIGITSGGGGISDLRAIASATDAFAPVGGVDCDGNATVDIPPGEPLVCSISASGAGIGNAIQAIVGAALGSPIADANGPYTIRVGETVTFDGSGSSDPDGTIALYEWDFESDGVFDFASTNPVATHIYPTQFTGKVTLRVTDNDGLVGANFASVVVRPLANLELVKTPQSNSAPVGQELVYTINVINHGPDNAEDVVITDVFLTGVNVISIAPDQGSCSHTNSVIACNLGSLAIGSQATISIVVSAVEGGILTNIATVEDRVSLDSDVSDNLAVQDVMMDSGTSVVIDIKPGSDPNSINCRKANVLIPVAILTTNSFDALTVDHTKVSFEGAGEAHVKNNGLPQRHEKDVDGDGDMDLVFHFRYGSTNLTCDSTEGTLIGQTFDGLIFEATDSVNMIR